MSKRSDSKAIQMGFDRLSRLFENGALMATATPALFLTLVADEIVELRAKIRAFEVNGGLRDKEKYCARLCRYEHSGPEGCAGTCFMSLGHGDEPHDCLERP